MADNLWSKSRAYRYGPKCGGGRWPVCPRCKHELIPEGGADSRVIYFCGNCEAYEVELD